jgi:putative ABC transport system substrate-binding protein
MKECAMNIVKSGVKRIIATLTFLLLGLNISAFASGTNAVEVKKIGILVPIALPAMDQIVTGYETELKKTYSGPIEFIVKNAQGNAGIQQAILQEFLAQPVDVIAPIGTDATEMAVHMNKNIPIVAIAADLPKGAHFSNVTSVLDEVSVSDQINFIHQSLPDLKKMTLIYSADDRIFADVKQVKAAADKAGIQVQALMVQALPDLYAVHDHIDSDTQAIFILKDELVVSGIRVLVQQAERRHIPVIASDDGSVANGAAFALGVKESDIGKYAAISTAKILNGTSAGDVPQVVMSHYTVFINEKSAVSQGVDVKFIEKIGSEKGFDHDAISQ